MSNQRTVLFATGNLHKFREAALVLQEYGLKITRVDLKGIEIQAETVEEVAKFSATQVAQQLQTQVIVEDTGIFIEALNGFPGPYSSYVHKTIGNKGVLKLLKGISNRRAFFRSAISYSKPNFSTRCFSGITVGKILHKEQGSYGFGYDPIFKPFRGGGKTYAEMTIEDKNQYSHRSKAFKKFVKWYCQNYKCKS